MSAPVSGLVDVPRWVMNKLEHDLIRQLNAQSTARLATLGQLRESILRVYLNPIPTNETLRSWFDQARIPRYKSNALARRGGGPVYYSVAAVEKFLRLRTLPGKLSSISTQEAA